MGDADPMYSTAQIAIPATLPEILKRYTKAAIKTQPDDLLQWSALYFEALAEGNPPPVSNRVVGKQTTVKDIKADAKPQEPVATAPPAEQQHDNSAQEPAATTNSPTSNTDTQADSATSEPLALDGALAQFAAHALHAGKIMSRAEAMKLASDTGISHKLIEDAMFMVGKDNRVSGPGITLILAGFFIPSSDDAFARLATLYDKEFRDWVKEKINERNQKQEVAQNAVIKMDPAIIAAFNSSTHHSSKYRIVLIIIDQKGSGAHVLKAGSKRRRTKQQIDADNQRAAQE